jgi:hypothetical protein
MGRQAETGEAAVIAARAGRDAHARGPGKEGRRRDKDAEGGRDEAWSNAALWRVAASQHAASEARRRERGGGTPTAPAAGREAYRPWFSDGADGEPWLSAEETGEPWFTREDPPPDG